MSLRTVRLHEIAHARTGDKGNRINISLIPYRPDLFDVLLHEVTPERVLKVFAHRGADHVERFELPNLHAMNFVIDNALEGGVNGSLNLDGHGKSLSFLLLSLDVNVPEELL